MVEGVRTPLIGVSLHTNLILFTAIFALIDEKFHLGGHLSKDGNQLGRWQHASDELMLEEVNKGLEALIVQPVQG